MTAAEHLAPYSPRTLRSWGGSLPGHSTREGTLVFADVSGFTRLTERLARQGKVGAEEMVLTISSVWEALLATDDGGDVLKFAGDALVLFYEGDDHAARASTRALAMQRELRRVGRIETRSGVVRLKMSIGIHSGEFHFFVVGRDHLELVMPGPDTTRALEMEKAAGAGQVVVSDATAAELGEQARFGERIEDGSVLRRVSPPTVIGPVPATARVDPARFVAPVLRDRLGQLDYEHRWAAVAFAHVGQIDRQLENEGPAAVFERLQAFTVDMMDTLAEHDVLLASSDLMADGVGFMLAAGVPQATGDDAAAVLAVGRRLLAGEVDLPVRVGANAGNVFVGDVGPPFRRAFVTMGDTTNLAARVMGRADWGTVLATDAVLRLAEGRFATRPIEPFHVKGKRRSIEAALVEDPHQADLGGLSSGPLVGRRAELATLEQALSDAREGRGSIVEIVGDQGTGRSRLVSELTGRAEGIATVGVACDPFERTSPYRSARHLLRQLLDIRADADPDEAGDRLAEVTEEASHLRPWLPLVASTIDARVDDTAETSEVADRYRRRRTQQAVADLVEAVVDGPRLVAIEDSELMDDASAELLAFVLARIERLPWLVVVTRTDDASGLHAGRGYPAKFLPLEPLSSGQTRELALRLAETLPVPRHLIGPVVERSGGNPLFLRELLAGAGDGEMPHSVEGIIAARIDSLPPDDRQALRYLSVLGEQFPARLVDETLADLGVRFDDPKLWKRLAGFLRHHDGQVAFVNPLVRQVAYEGLTFDLRRRIHSAVAEALAHSGDDTLPVHLLRGGRWSEAWYAAWRASERAERTGANAVAAELLDLALEAGRQWQPPTDELWQVAVRAGDCWARAGVPERALADYALAVAHAPTPADRLRMAAARAAVHENAGRFRQALTLYTRAMREATEMLADDRAEILALLHAGYASTRQRQGRYEEAIAHARLALEHAEAGGDQALQAHAHHLLDRLHTARGENDEALRHRDAALPLFALLGDLAAQGTVLHDLAADAHRAGRLDEAAWLYSRAIDVRARAGDVARATASTNALGEVEMGAGRLDQAEEHFTEALRTWRGARSPHGVVVAATNLGELYLRRGLAAEALDWLEEALRRAGELGTDHPVATTQVPLAEAFVQLGRHVEAWEAATLALENGAAPELRSRAHRARAAALAATGGRARAEQELVEAATARSDCPGRNVRRTKTAPT